MNKYREALQFLMTLDCGGNFYVDNQKGDACEILSELVDKATPKKRVYVDTTPSISSHFICPVCRTKVSPIGLYCDTCGQRLE